MQLLQYTIVSVVVLVCLPELGLGANLFTTDLAIEADMNGAQYDYSAELLLQQVAAFVS